MAKARKTGSVEASEGVSLSSGVSGRAITNVIELICALSERIEVRRLIMCLSSSIVKQGSYHEVDGETLELLSKRSHREVVAIFVEKLRLSLEASGKKDLLRYVNEVLKGCKFVERFDVRGIDIEGIKRIASKATVSEKGEMGNE